MSIHLNYGVEVGVGARGKCWGGICVIVTPILWIISKVSLAHILGFLRFWAALSGTFDIKILLDSGKTNAKSYRFVALNSNIWILCKNNCVKNVNKWICSKVLVIFKPKYYCTKNKTWFLAKLILDNSAQKYLWRWQFGDWKHPVQPDLRLNIDTPRCWPRGRPWWSRCPR